MIRLLIHDADGLTLQRLVIDAEINMPEIPEGLSAAVYEGPEDIEAVETTIVDGEIVFQARMIPLAEARLAKLAEISRKFEGEVAKGCPSPKGWVDCDDKAQGRVANMVSLRKEATTLSIPLDPTVDWTMLDKSQVPHDDAELIALGLAIGFGFAEKFKNKQALEAQALAANDHGSLEAIDITSGWPL